MPDTLWVREPGEQSPVLIAKAAYDARIVKPEVLGEACTLSDFTRRLEAAFHEVRGLEYVDVLMREVNLASNGKMVERDVPYRCRVEGDTRRFVDRLTRILDDLVKASAKYDGLVDDLIDSRDALKRECEDLSTRIANVRKALIASE